MLVPTLWGWLGLLSLGFGGCGVGAVEPIQRAAHQPTSNGSKLLTFDAVQSGQLYAESKQFHWVSVPGKDGIHITTGPGGAIVLEDIVTQNQTVLIPGEKVPRPYREYWINANLTKILYATQSRKQYRYSYFANYVVQDVVTGVVTPLTNEQGLDVQYAVWSPTNKYGDMIAYVRNNDIYLWKNGARTRVTFNGGPDQFNGVPDWIYEEEILSERFALWWKPDGSQLAYLSFNETGVPTYRVTYYMDRNNVSASIAPAYPRELELRYPKVGAVNPTVKASLLRVDWGPEGPKPMELQIEQFEPEEQIIGEVAWLGERVAVRAFNRIQDQSKLVVYDTRANVTVKYKVAKSQEGSDGWLDNNLFIRYIGVISGAAGELWNQQGLNGCCEEYYLDKTDLTNWDHLYLNPTNYFQNDPIPLTWGDYDVREILFIDKVRHVVYYSAAERHSTESHVYAISYRSLEKVAVSDTSKPGFHTASFSPGGNYYVLSYQGPNVPYQELYAVDDNRKPLRTITSNNRLINTLKDYKLPMIRYADLKHPAGYNLSAMLRYPASFDPSKKYPVLFTPYGGPGSQEVTKRMSSFDFKSYVSSDPELEYITLTLDGRGTGFRGREFRATVARHLGQFEAEDQIWAAKTLIRQNSWVDKDHVAIWGWSYGGYLSAKVVEKDSGVFSLGLITAPVVDFRLYDSMFTERYMGLPTANAEGYATSAIKKADGFKNIAGGVLIQHGLGDDNVHFQNSAALVDTLIGAGVSPQKLQVQYFTDSDHNLNYHNANRFVYKQLAKKLFEEKLRSPNATAPHQWTKWTDARNASASASASGGRDEYERRVDAFMAKLDAGGDDVVKDGRDVVEDDLRVNVRR